MAYVFWLLSFLGLSGIHRFYLGKWISGLIWFLTFGLFFIGTIVDAIILPGMVERKNTSLARGGRLLVWPTLRRSVPRQLHRSRTVRAPTDRATKARQNGAGSPPSSSKSMSGPPPSRWFEVGPVFGPGEKV